MERDREMPNISDFLRGLWSKIRSLFGFLGRINKAEVMETDLAVEQQTAQPNVPGLRLRVAFDPFVRVSELKGKRRTRRVQVSHGSVAFAAHDAEWHDYEGLPENYRADEVVVRPEQRGSGRSVVVELAETPGYIQCILSARLAGISATESDLAQAYLGYQIRLFRPSDFLAVHAGWPSPEGRSELTEMIRSWIEECACTVLFEDAIQVWSSPRVADAAAMLYDRLDATLKGWGLALSKPVAWRKFPGRLTAIALGFEAAERGLLELPPLEREQTLAELRLTDGDRLMMENEAKRRGWGAGLFLAARKDSQRFAEWLRKAGMFELAEFLDRLCSEKPQEIALTENVLLSAFRHPLLWVGERRDKDLALTSASDYYEFESHFGSRTA